MTSQYPETAEPYKTQACVVGGGPAGLASALALALSGCETLCVGQGLNPAFQRRDARTTALLAASVNFLQNLGVWQECASHAAPLEHIRIIDDTGRLLRAPEVTFSAAELNVGAFGYNIANTQLVAALLKTADRCSNLKLLETRRAEVIETGPDSVLVKTEEGALVKTRLVVAADGRNSDCRTRAGIGTRNWTYPQTAIACNFSHSEPHHNVSNEFHREAGPFTTVPLPGSASSLVWVETPDEAARLMALDDKAFAATIEDRLHGILGAVEISGKRGSFPLSGLVAARFMRNRTALVGEAAHVIPPIGAQGLNLGFRDAKLLAEVAGSAMSDDHDPGSDRVEQRYNRARRGDVYTRTIAVDILNRSLISSLLPAQVLRMAGMQLLNRISPLRRYVMRQGIAPGMGEGEAVL